MSGVRVDLDDLLAKARASLSSVRERGDATEPFGPVCHAWALSPRRDGAVDVVVASSGADVFDRALEVDARFSVAAQPAVVEAMVLRIQTLESAYGDLIEATALAGDPGDVIAMRELQTRGVVLP